MGKATILKFCSGHLEACRFREISPKAYWAEQFCGPAGSLELRIGLNPDYFSVS